MIGVMCACRLVRPTSVADSQPIPTHSNLVCTRSRPKTAIRFLNATFFKHTACPRRGRPLGLVRLHSCARGGPAYTRSGRDASPACSSDAETVSVEKKGCTAAES
jgi:hypothetical protein